MSRKPFTPTEKQRQTVQMAKAAGLTNQQIADLIGVDEKTMVKHLGRELSSANAHAITAVANNLYKRAVSQEKEAVPAAIFWLKTRGGWRETSVHEVTGKDGGPVEHKQRGLSRNELIEELQARGLPTQVFDK